MPIPLTCTCGRSLKARDELAGRKVRCPDCKNVLEVPDPNAPKDPEDEILNVLLADDPPAGDEESQAAVRAEPPPVPREISIPPPRKPLPPPPSVRSVKRKTRDVKRSTPPVVFEEGWFGNVNAGAIGGLLMMGIAAVWFFIGLAAGRLFFYPPFLFVVGFIAMIKGMTGRD
jgi:hypothetical protein